jgi:hypothetical protein
MSKAFSRRIFFLILLSVVTLLPSCQHSIGEGNTLPVLSENNLPIVHIDYDHDWINEHVNKDIPIPEYQITAGNGFVLNASNCKIIIPSHLTVFNVTRPNRVYVYIRYGGYDYDYDVYYLDWVNNSSELVVTSQDLILLDHTAEKSNVEFISGQNMNVLIGYFDKNGKTTGHEIFYPLWGATVYVQ